MAMAAAILAELLPLELRTSVFLTLIASPNLAFTPANFKMALVVPQANLRARYFCPRIGAPGARHFGF